MKQTFCLFFVLCGWNLLLFSATAPAREVDVEPLVAKLRAVGPKGAGGREAAAAWKMLSQANVNQLPEILAGMKGAGDLGTNWIRAAVEAIAQREIQNRGKLPIKDLEKFLADKQHAPRARRLAYELVASVDSTAKARLIPGMMDDPSLELRRDAVQMALDNAAQLAKQKKKEAALKAYRRALTSARGVDQIKAAVAALRKLGQKPDVASHFGFLRKWKLAAPFDNTGQSGFDVAYPPEKQVRLMARYQGKEGQVTWKDYASDDEYGMVDLNKALGKFKGAAAYAFTEFYSDRPRDVELRLSCINANKVWLNGKLLTANEVYHTGMFIDQYVGRGRLKAGRNEILLKICQNEQTEDWAQNWQFQIRACDPLGTAIHGASSAGNE